MNGTEQRPMTALKALERLEMGNVVNLADQEQARLLSLFAVYRLNKCYRGRWAHGLEVGHPDITGGDIPPNGDGVKVVPVYTLAPRQIAAFARLNVVKRGGLALALMREYQQLKPTNKTELAEWIRLTSQRAWDTAQAYADQYNAIHGLTATA